MNLIPAEVFDAHASLHRRRCEEGLLGVPFSHVTIGESGRLDLQLSGVLPDDWCLRLANGLSAARIGLQNGYAREIEERIWICQLEVRRQPEDPRMPDFLGLATQGTLRGRRGKPPILDFELSETSSRGEVLDLRVVAHDAVGLLAAVLHRVRAVGLSISELLLATSDDAATHRIAIQRRDGCAPKPIDRRAIASSLAELVRSR